MSTDNPVRVALFIENDTFIVTFRQWRRTREIGGDTILQQNALWSGWPFPNRSFDTISSTL